MMISKKIISRIIYILIIVSVIFSINSIVFADGTAYGSWGYMYNIYGHSYKMRNKISIYGYHVSAHVEILSIYGIVPIGYMGYKARCLNDAGVLVAESSWAYNNSPLIGIGGNVPLTGTYGESYYSDGITRVWNGTGYWTYGGVPSPKMTCKG